MPSKTGIRASACDPEATLPSRSHSRVAMKRSARALSWRRRLSLNSADLSAYDPNYGEFTVGALAPSTVIPFEAFRQKVGVRFGNAKTAQSWKAPAADAGLVESAGRGHDEAVGGVARKGGGGRGHAFAALWGRAVGCPVVTAFAGQVPH